MTIPEQRLCRRLTNAGKPCRARRITVYPKGDQVDPWSCWQHLTSEEQVAFGYDKPVFPRLSEEEEARRLWLALDVPPACWFWPVPGDLDRTDPEAALSAWQAGRCAICGDRDRLVTDHDHETGMGRGLLCRSCNTCEGVPLYRYQPATVYAYYRQRPPVVILGISFRYYDPMTGEYDPGHGPPPPFEDRWKDNAMRGAL